jgi:hypothetical protein
MLFLHLFLILICLLLITFALALTTMSEPTSFAQASQIPHWREAMLSEFTALEANDTWVVTDLPAGKQPLGVNGCIRLSSKLMVL